MYMYFSFSVMSIMFGEGWAKMLGFVMNFRRLAVFHANAFQCSLKNKQYTVLHIAVFSFLDDTADWKEVITFDLGF